MDFKLCEKPKEDITSEDEYNDYDYVTGVTKQKIRLSIKPAKESGVGKAIQFKIGYYEDESFNEISSSAYLKLESLDYQDLMYEYSLTEVDESFESKGNEIRRFLEMYSPVFLQIF